MPREPASGQRGEKHATLPRMARLSGHPAHVYITTALFQTLWGIVKYLPTPVGDVIRHVVLHLSLRACGVPATWIRAGIDIWWPRNIAIGRSCLNENLFFNGYGGITIGDYCLIGRGTSFFSGGHTFDRTDNLIIEQPLTAAPIVVGDDVYFGLNCTVLGGVTIGSGAVIGAGSVVIDDVPPLAIVAGIPARLLRYRNEDPLTEKSRSIG